MNKELYEKLNRVQNKLNVPKNLYNKFGGFSYRSAEGILEAVKPLLEEERLNLILTDTIEVIGERYYIKAQAILTDIDRPMIEDDEVSLANSIVTQAYAREDENKKGMDGSQLTGSTSSYARKYALNAMFLIDDVKDADTDEFNEQISTNVDDVKISPKQIEIIEKYYQGQNMEKLLSTNKLAKLEDMPLSKASEIIGKLFNKGEN
jgi:hypothetical protein|nr:MAG TPA_asm: ERF superfamily protein [Caudoviricetes sp.]